MISCNLWRGFARGFRAWLVPLCWIVGACSAPGAFVVEAKGLEEIPVRIADPSDEEMGKMAAEMSALLERIFGRPFPVQGMEKRTGFVLGTVAELPEFGEALSTDDLSSADAYVHRSFDEGVYLVGKSRVGLSNAIWGMMQELGYRHYFPNPKWEIVPRLESFRFELDRVVRPSFAARILAIGGNTWPELREEYRIWQQRNRLLAAFSLRTGHAYDGIEARNQEELARHPEYLSNPLGTPNNKFVVAEKGLRELVVADARAQLEANPEVDSLSMDPSDGGGWPAESPLGSPSNQAVSLANEVAGALQRVKPGVKVGLYAYNEHSAPPTIAVNPNVIVSVATAFIRGGFRFEELVEGWANRGASIGVRDYLGVYSWDFDQPGKSRAASPRGVARQLAEYYRLGARYFVAEVNHGFGSSGLGLYVAARCLWDVGESARVDAMLEEFYQTAFGPAATPMRRFYEIIDADRAPLLSPYLWGAMCRELAEAYRLAGDDEAVLGRLDDLAAYTRYLTLFRNYIKAEGSAKNPAFRELADYAMSIRASGMVHGWGMLRHLPRRDKGLDYAQDLGQAVALARDKTPPTHRELRDWVEAGATNFPVLSFTPVSFSDRLIPKESFATTSSPMEHTLRMRRNNTLYTWLQKPGIIRFKVQGGTLHGNRGPIRIRLYPRLEPLGAAVAEVEVPADGETHAVELASDFEGLQKIEIQDGGDLTILSWPHERPLTIPSGQEESAALHQRHDLYFYVPPGTKTVAGFSTGTSGEIVTQDNRVVFRFADLSGEGMFEVQVPEGMDGQVWSLRRFSGRRLLMTVPPFLAPHPELLLIPEELAVAPLQPR